MVSSPPIRILLVDARADTAARLACAHDPTLVGLTVVSSGSSVQALDLCLAVKPDVALFEIYVPDSSAIDVIRAIRMTTPQVKVLVLSSSAEVSFARAVLSAGASGFLLDHIDLTDLAVSLRTVYSGRIVLSPIIAHALIQSGNAG